MPQSDERQTIIRSGPTAELRLEELGIDKQDLIDAVHAYEMERSSCSALEPTIAPAFKSWVMEGRGPVGKTAVAGAKDRATNKVSAQVVDSTDADTLQGFISDRVVKGATVYTDEHCSYEGLPFPHESVKHSVGEYVRDQAHINGVESFWSMLKRGYYGTYHRMSPKHLQKYTDEFSGRHNMRELDTLTQMVVMVRGLDGKRLCYKDLVS